MSEEEIKFRGNPHHLSQLSDAVTKGDISIWNSYVRKNGAAFRARLAGADLSGMNLGEIRLDGADLSETNLSGCILTRANLSGARLRNANLSNTDLTGARLIRTDLTNASLIRARMTEVRARGAILVGANLTEARLDGADLSKASMRGASVTGASRSGASMKIKVKVKAAGRQESVEAPEPISDNSPWLKALVEEERLKELRKIREKKKAEADKARLDRKLGRRKPLFDRAK